MLAKRDEAVKDASVRYLTGPEKEILAATEQAFTVNDVAVGEGDFGKRWELVIDIDGDERILTISRNRARDPLMRELQRLCKQAPQGPLVLDVVEKEDGTTFQWFKRPGVTTPATPKASASEK